MRVEGSGRELISKARMTPSSVALCGVALVLEEGLGGGVGEGEKDE